MADLSFLTAYRNRESQLQQQPMRELQQFSTLQNILSQQAQAQRQQQLAPMEAMLIQAKVEKMRQEQELNKQFAGGNLGGNFGALTADQADALATKAAIGNHPGAIGFARLAEQKRAAENAKSTLATMRDTPQGLSAGAVVGNQQVLQAIPPEDVAAFAKVAQAAQQGRTASATPQAGDPVMAGGGAFSPLLGSSSQGIAARARQLQTMVNNGGGNLPMIERELTNLTKMDAGFAEARKARDVAQAGRIEIKNMFPPAASGAPARGNATPTPGDFSKSGDEFLASLPERDRGLVKGLASYEIDPKTLSVRGGHREEILKLVKQLNPAYDDTQYGNKRRAIAQFGSGPQGNTVRSLNVAIEHIDTLQRAADALQNREFTPGNRAYNELAKLFGKTPPNTFEGIRDIVANEVIKGTIGNAGALADREGAAAKVKASNSPQQLAELFTGWQELMGGQVKGLEQQYRGSTQLKDFRERYMTLRAIQAIDLAESKAGGGIPEFATEADAIASGKKGKVRINGRNATIQ